jgi:hypothetical protein
MEVPLLDKCFLSEHHICIDAILKNIKAGGVAEVTE